MSSTLHSYPDPVTGRKVTRLTATDEHCHHPYFYNTCFTPDGRQALVIANKGKTSHVRLVSTETGNITPLVSGEDIARFMVTLTADGKYLYYSQNNQLHRKELQTGEDLVVWTQQIPWNGNSIYPGFSSDYKHVLFSQIHVDDVVPRTGGWSFFEPQFRAKPRCRLLMLNLETGKETVVLEQDLWLGHPQICPSDPNTLMYCHEGPGNLIDARVWLVQADGTNIRCMGYHEEAPGAGAPEYITHECFMPDGANIVYIRLPKTHEEKVAVDLRSVADFSLTSSYEVEGYLHVGPSPNGQFLAGDQRTEKRTDACIWLLNLSNGQEQKLCIHGSSYAARGNSTQDAHPHPAFSPDGNRILFSSDRETGPEGNCSIYCVDLH